MCSSDKKPVCHIVCGGDFDPARFQPAAGDFVIAADRGYRYLEELGRVPDLVLGDFDSLGAVPVHDQVICLPAEKDDTDTLYAVRVGLERGYTRFLLHAALGGDRLDHTIANLQTLLFLTLRGGRGWLLGGDDTVLSVLHEEAVTFPAEQEGMLSVFCLGDRAEGVDLTGVKYPLRDACLTQDLPLGVSNEFTGVPAGIRVRKGNLLILWHDDVFRP